MILLADMAQLPEIGRADWLARRKRETFAGWIEYTSLEKPNVTMPFLPSKYTRAKRPSICSLFAYRPFIPSWSHSEQEKRLMLLSAHLETVDQRHFERGEPTYKQTDIRHPCGTPACAIGHGMKLFSRMLPERSFTYTAADLLGLYGAPEYFELFGSLGCAQAQTAADAAAYIKRFVLEKRHPLHTGVAFTAEELP